MNPVLTILVITITFAQGGAMILNQDTLIDGRLLIPIVIWTMGVMAIIGAVARASWVISARLRDITNRFDSGAERMKRIEERITNLEKKNDWHRNSS